MSAVLLACPTCHRPVAFDDAALHAPAGRVSYATCPECHHKAASTAFQREHEQQQKAIAKEKTRKRRKGEKAARIIQREREQEHARQLREAEQSCRLVTIKQDFEARQVADAKRAEEVRKAKLVIPCRVCMAGELVKKEVPRLGKTAADCGMYILVLCPFSLAVSVALLVSGDVIGAVGFSSGVAACILGGLLRLHKTVLQCDKCGAVVPAS